MPAYRRAPSPNELYHHGIRGQKWGKRNGPPYPLDSDVKREEYGRLFSKNKSNIREEDIIDGKYNRNQNDSLKNACKTINKGYPTKAGTTNNCMMCTAAMNLQFKGYNFDAGTTKKPIGQASIFRWFKGTKEHRYNGLSGLNDFLSKAPEGTHGAIGVSQTEQSLGFGKSNRILASHIIAFNVDKNGITVYDGQNGYVGSADKYFSTFKFDKNIDEQLFDMTNAKPNFKALIKDGVITPRNGGNK